MNRQWKVNLFTYFLHPQREQFKKWKIENENTLSNKQRVGPFILKVN